MFASNPFYSNHELYPYSADIPDTLLMTINDHICTGNSKDVTLYAIKLLQGGYYLNFKNHYFMYNLLIKEHKLINFIDDILKINSEINNDEKIQFILNDVNNYQFINNIFFIFIYQWFTDFSLNYLEKVIKNKHYKRKEIADKHLIIINGNDRESIDYYSKSPNYQDFKNWLGNNYKNGNMSFLSLINNEELESYVDENNNKIYELNDEEYITDENIYLKKLKEMPYNDYLKTMHWKIIKYFITYRANYKCQLCGTSKDILNVHHNTYKNRGEEKLEDLIVLCKKCHEKFHDKL